MTSRFLFLIILVFFNSLAHGHSVRQTKGDFHDAFRQLDEILPTPTEKRTANGKPGPAYWQQRADYKINIELDEEQKRLTGNQVIRYYNNSPHSLPYIWLQLEQNRFRNDSEARLSEAINQTQDDDLSYSALAREQAYADGDYGFQIKEVRIGNTPAQYNVMGTLMRIDLTRPLNSGGQLTLNIRWQHNLIDEARVSGRSGYEYFESDDTYIFFAGQWFPRIAAYTDYGGWENRSFLGGGEFTLEFGDYDVAITVPANHLVSATGSLSNPNDVLSSEQIDRLQTAETANTPVFVVTPEEAKSRQEIKSTNKKTWRFRARNVRDFAWSSSSKFIWDAMGVKTSPKADRVMAMSFYPNEALGLWSRYSTRAIAHTLQVYSRFLFDYPYPVAQSVNVWELGGMEYPMVAFNGFRPKPLKASASTKDGAPDSTYSLNIKYRFIGLVIHEIGHNYFPMIVNSDERQWAWMDEGLNSFLDFTATTEWEKDFPYDGGGSNAMTEVRAYLQDPRQVPVMTQADSVLQRIPNSYTKPTAALMLLRETILGRERFDFALKQYASEWKFKRPTPADFFRTMEEAGGADLDWFWRGWFYTTDHVDLALTDVREYRISSLDPEVEFPLDRTRHQKTNPESVTQSKNREQGLRTYVENDPQARDFYNEHDRFTVTDKDRENYRSTINGLKSWEKIALERALAEKTYVYFLDIQNLGGLVSPIPVTLEFVDGSTESMVLPAQIWRRNPTQISKMLLFPKQVIAVRLDIRQETGDVDIGNNNFPRTIRSDKLELSKSSRQRRNLMADFFERINNHGEKPKTEVRLSTPTE